MPNKNAHNPSLQTPQPWHPMPPGAPGPPPEARKEAALEALELDPRPDPPW